MSPIGQGAAGLAVALSLFQLATPRIGAAATLCALQAVVVAAAAAAQRQPIVAALELALAAAIPLFVGWCPVTKAPRTDIRAGLLIGSTLTLLAVTLPGTHLALAVVLTGATMIGTRRSPLAQVVGLASLHHGVVLAAIGGHLSAGALAIAALPVLPALAGAGVWLAGGDSRLAVPAAWQPGKWIDPICCTAVLAAACVLPALVPMQPPGLHLGPFAAHAILLLSLVACGASWSRVLDGKPTPVPGARLLLLAGAAFAVAANQPMLTWLGLTLATTAAAATCLPRRAAAWRRPL